MVIPHDSSYKNVDMAKKRKEKKKNCTLSIDKEKTTTKIKELKETWIRNDE